MQTLSPNRFLIQLPFSMMCSALMTAAMLLLMQALVAVDLPPIETSKRVRFNPVMDPPKPPERHETIREERPKDPDTEPAPMEQLTFTGPQDGGLSYGAGEKPTFSNPDLSAGSGSSTIVPIFRIAPDYPVSASRRGIEGFVDLLFDVAATGKTENVRVIDSHPDGVFERAAIRALSKWKYKAPMEEGVAYGQKNMTTRIRFRLES